MTYEGLYELDEETLARRRQHPARRALRRPRRLDLRDPRQSLGDLKLAFRPADDDAHSLRCTSTLVHTPTVRVGVTDRIRVRARGLRCVTAERLILDSLLFRFTQDEIHNAIDSAIRMRLVSEKRLRRRIVDDLAPNAWHRRTLIDAMVDAGGESALERRFLAIVRHSGLARPEDCAAPIVRAVGPWRASMPNSPVDCSWRSQDTALTQLGCNASATPSGTPSSHSGARESSPSPTTMFTDAHDGCSTSCAWPE